MAEGIQGFGPRSELAAKVSRQRDRAIGGFEDVVALRD